MLSSFSEIYTDIHIMAQIEQYYDQMNDKQGRLVRGSNWADERFSNIFGKNVAGMSAKVFANPHNSYSTVGFRYVIHIWPKVIE